MHYIEYCQCIAENILNVLKKVVFQNWKSMKKNIDNYFCKFSKKKKKKIKKN